MTVSRSFHSSAVVFTVVYSVSYLIAVQNNYALFTYHPALEELARWYSRLATVPPCIGTAG